MNYFDESGDLERESTGVLASLRNSPNGKTELVFDDAASVPMLDASQWSQEHLYTIKEFDAVRLEKMEFSKAELVEIAENLLIRLRALRK